MVYRRYGIIFRQIIAELIAIVVFLGGCSCNLYENEVGETVENKDELGRLLPCCEYMYNEKGFDDLDEINTII